MKAGGPRIRSKRVQRDHCSQSGGSMLSLCEVNDMGEKWGLLAGVLSTLIFLVLA